MKTGKTFGDFVRECYLRSEPSVDLREVPDGVMVDCTKHRLSVEAYEDILREYEISDGTDEILGCAMFMVQSGPQLYESK